MEDESGNRGWLRALLALLVVTALGSGVVGVSRTSLGDFIPADVPVLGRNADDVFRDMQDAGLPITDGRPQSDEFADVFDRNACKSSRGVVRTDADVGWALICVKPPRDAYREMSSRFEDGVPLIAGPLYVDDGGGEVIVFGLGWPPDASKQVYDAINASGGSFLTKE